MTVLLKNYGLGRICQPWNLPDQSSSIVFDVKENYGRSCESIIKVTILVSSGKRILNLACLASYGLMDQCPKIFLC